MGVKVSSNLLGGVARGVQDRPLVIIVLVLIMTGFFGVQLTNIKFETNFDKFQPESDMNLAADRAADYFGEDAQIHFILVHEDNREEDVLTIDAQREQYMITQAVKEIDGVDMTVSFVDLMDVIVKIDTSKGEINENWTVGNVDDSSINRWTGTLLKILNGTLDLSGFLGAASSEITLSNSTLDELEFLVTFLLSSDFDIDHHTHALSTIIVVQLDGTLTAKELKALSNHVRETVDEMSFDEITVRHTSQHILAYDVDSASGETNRILIGGIFGLMILILAFSFRKLSYITWPILTLIITMVWTLGTMQLIGLNFTAMAVAVIPLVIGLGIDYSVHISRRYQEERAKGLSVSEAISVAITTVGSAVLLAVITTVIAFLSNLTSSIIPIRDFGISCAIGVSYAFLLTITLYASLRYLADGGMRERKAEKPVPDESALILHALSNTKELQKKENSLTYRLSCGISNVVRNHAKPLAVLILAISVVGLYGAVLVPSEFNIEDFLPPEWDSVLTADALREDFEAGSYTVTYVLVEGTDLSTVEAFNSVISVQDEMADDSHLVKVETSEGSQIHSESIADLSTLLTGQYPELAIEYNLSNLGHPTAETTDADVRAYFDHIYDNTTVSDQFSNLTMGDRVKKVLHRDGGNYDATIIRVYENSDGAEQTSRVYDELNEDVQKAGFPSGATATVTGGMVMTIQVIASLQQNMINSTILAVIMAALVVALIYRNAILGLLPTIPVVTSSIWILGTMYVISVPLNVLTVMVTALTIGLGIDYSIHVMERFKEEVDKGASADDAIHSTVLHTGSALIISAVTTIAAFLSLIISPMPVVRQFGLITAITITYSLLLSIFALPIILVWRGRRQENKEKKKEESSEPTQP